jgi:hypothetical protein
VGEVRNCEDGMDMDMEMERVVCGAGRVESPGAGPAGLSHRERGRAAGVLRVGHVMSPRLRAGRRVQTAKASGGSTTGGRL